MRTPEHLVVVVYDIRCSKRWRLVHRLMRGQGQWLQLSVFQCLLDGPRKARMADRLRQVIDPLEDHVLIFDLGPAQTASPQVVSLGLPYAVLEREVMVL